ncbi:MAG: LacI family DNA-binding transcriptional regulator [Petrotogales bacterium]
MSRITLSRIADETNVSVSTVSRVLKGDSRISEKTKYRVLVMAKKLGYLSSEVPSNGKVILFLVVASHNSVEADEFFSKVQKGILTGASNSNTHCLVRSISPGEQLHPTSLPLDLIDGVIVGGIPMSDDIQELILRLKEPAVRIGWYKKLSKLPSVNNDNVRGGYIAAKELYRFGYDRIVILTGNLKVATFRDRVDGFFKALREEEFDEKNVEIIKCESFEEDEGYKRIKTGFSPKKDANNAIFCTTDWLAKGALEATKDLGLNIPEEVGIMGFSGLSFTEQLRPSLSTVALNPYLLGRTAYILLQDIINGIQEAKGSIFVEPTLLIRDSLKRR